MAFVIVILMGIALLAELISAASDRNEARNHADYMRRIKDAYRR